MRDFFCFLTAMLTALSLFIFGLLAFFHYAGTKPACEQYARLTGAEISTQFFGAGCLVKYQGRWVDYDTAVAKKHEITVDQK